MRKRVFSVFVLGMLLAIGVLLIVTTACKEDSQSITISVPTKTSEEIEPVESPVSIREPTPTETPALRLEITFPTPAVAVQTPVAPESSGKDSYISPQPEVKTVDTPELGPEFTGLTKEALEEAREQAEETARKFPIAQILPHGGPPDGKLFAIYSPTSEGRIIIMIDATADFEETKEAALGWIRSQKYNPDDYDIRFETGSFSK